MKSSGVGIVRKTSPNARPSRFDIKSMNMFIHSALFILTPGDPFLLITVFMPWSILALFSADTAAILLLQPTPKFIVPL